MIRITCHAARFRGGMKHETGVKDYPVGTFDDEQIRAFEDDPDFDIQLDFEPGAGLKSPEDLSLAQAVEQAAKILSPAAEEYGVDQLDVRLYALFEVKDPVVTGETFDDKELDAVIAACVELEAAAPRDESKFAGDKPKTKVLSDMAGFRVSGQMRDAAWAAANGEK